MTAEEIKAVKELEKKAFKKAAKKAAKEAKACRRRMRRNSGKVNPEEVKRLQGKLYVKIIKYKNEN